MRSYSTNNLSKLAQKITDSIINRQEIKREDISAYFNQTTTNEIIEKLNAPKTKREREQIIHLFNKSKKEEWEKLLKKIQLKQKKKSIYMFSRVAAAAVIVLILSTSYYIFTNQKVKEIQLSTEKHIDIGKQDIILKLDNGQYEILSNNGSKKLINSDGILLANQQQKRLEYKLEKSHKKPDEIPYHELRVPYG